MDKQQVLEIHVDSEHAAEHVKQVQKLGFTQVIGDSAVAQAAIGQKLYFVLANFWTTEECDWDKHVLPRIKDFVNSKHLVSINMMDEPIYWDFDDDNHPKLPVRTPACYRTIHDQIRRTFPHVDLSLAFFGPDSGNWQNLPREYYFLAYLPAIEQLRMNLYPALKNCPLGVVFDWIARLKATMAAEQQPMPLTVSLQTWCYDEHPRYPSIDELRVMSYAALLGGANTVSFYHYDPDVWEQLPGFPEDFGKLIGELNDRTKELVGAKVKVGEPEQGVYRATVQPLSGSPFDVLINTTDRQVAELRPYEVCWNAVS